MNNSFVAIDFETANSFRGSVCELGLVRVIDGIVDDSFAVLVKPHADHSHFDGINVSIHGIHPTDVLAAEEFDTLWPALESFIGDFPLVAHNAAFDIGALRELFALYAIEVPTIYYFCSLALSRRALDLVSFSLPFVAKNFGIGRCQAAWSRSSRISVLVFSGRLMPTVSAGAGVVGWLRNRSGCAA